MTDDIIGFSLRVNRELFAKFRYIAEYNGRSANSEIVQYLKLRVKKFEEEVEKIEISAK